MENMLPFSGGGGGGGGGGRRTTNRRKNLQLLEANSYLLRVVFILKSTVIAPSIGTPYLFIICVLNFEIVHSVIS